MDRVIASPQNPRVKFLRSLRLRKFREQERLYLVEGIRIVAEALNLGAPVESVVYAPSLLVSDRAQGLVEGLPPERRLALSGEAFRSLSDREDPQGIAAVVRIEERGLGAIPLEKELLVLVAHQIHDPGNLGTMIRTADAVGASGVVVVGPGADVYDPQTVRATMGSLFAVPTVCLADEGSLLPWYDRMRSAGLALQVVASSARGRQVHFQVDYRCPVVLIVGSERYGLPASVRESADVVVRLPMAGRATSLNVAAATAALAYEIVRQRSTAKGLSQEYPSEPARRPDTK